MKKIDDAFSDLPVSRQRKWQLRRLAEGKCVICGGTLFRHPWCRKHYADALERKRGYGRKLKGWTPWKRGGRGRPPVDLTALRSGEDFRAESAAKGSGEGDREGMSITKDRLVELVYRALPLSEQICSLDTSEKEAIRFTWRSTRFRLSTSFFGETVEGQFLVGGDTSILLEALVKKQYIEELGKKWKEAEAVKA